MARVVLSEAYSRVFEDAEFGEGNAIPLMVRTKLLLEIKKIILKKGWTQRQAAAELKVKQPRISEIMGLRIDKFSVELLIRYLDRLGKRVQLNVTSRRSDR
jgi:predicted XRE-type DNA-binding protein